MIQEFWPLFGPLATGAVILRLAAALVLAGALGLEREVRDKAAGLRTNMMVALAACLFTLISLILTESNTVTDEALRIDPLRVVEAVASATAILAAGSIITARGGVTGLTTGAGMWLSAAIGVTCGIGQIPLAGLVTVLGLIVLRLLHRLERKTSLKEHDKTPEDDR